jgi:hypothetical protein
MPGTPLAMAWAKAWREVQILRSSGAETWQGLIFVSQKSDIYDYWDINRWPYIGLYVHIMPFMASTVFMVRLSSTINGKSIAINGFRHAIAKKWDSYDPRQYGKSSMGMKLTNHHCQVRSCGDGKNCQYDLSLPSGNLT